MGFSEYWPQPDNDKNKYTDKGAPKTPSENTTAKKDANIFNEGTTGVNNTVYNKTSSIFDSNKNLNQSNNEMFGQTNDTIPALNPSVLNILDYTEKQVQEIVIKVILDDAENSRLHLMQQNNGVISGLYDKYKEWRDDDLSLSNVEEAVVLQQESADNLQKAKDGNLSKKEYFLQNREHLKTMMKRRLFRKDENTGLDFLDRNRGSMTKEEFEKMMEDYINYQIDQIDKLDSLKNFQRMLFVTTGNGLEQMLLNYKKKAEEVKHNPAVEQKFTHKEFSNIPQEYDSTEPITFEEVFKFERNQEYSTDRIINYLILEANTTGAFNAYDNRNKYYSNLEIYKQYMASIGIDVNKQVQEFKEDYDAVMNNGVMNLLNNWDDLQYDNNYESFLKQMDDKTKSSHRSAFGEDYAIDLVQAMEKDNKAFMETIDKCTDGTQIAGLGCTIVGGILCFTPAAAAGAGLITLGNTLSIGGLAAENVVGYTEALTRQKIDSEEIEELNSSLFMDAGGFLIGAAAGKAGMKAFNKLIDVKLAEVFKLQTFKGNRAEALKQVFTNPDYLKNFMQAAGVKLSADFLISYAGDLAMSEVLGTDDDWESLLKANLIGLAASTSGDISNVARIGMKGEKYRELKQQVQNRSQEYRESLNETFANVDSKYKNSTEKYQQVIDKAVKCYEEFGVKIEFEDINGDYGATVTEIYKELHNFSKINGLKAPDKIKIKKDEKTEVYWDKNTNEITYVIGDKVKSDDVRYSLRHELVHGNDTKPELGDEFPESFKKEKIDEYIKEMLKAGLIPEEIAYAFQNRKEFLAIASQGDVSKYESLKQVLADCGMPEEVLNMPLADIHSRKVNCSDEELNNLAQQTIDQINRNGGVGYKPSEDKLHVWNKYDSQGHHINSAGQIDHVAEQFQYDANNGPQPLATLFDRGSYNPITRTQTVGSYKFNNSALIEATGGTPLVEKQIVIERSGSRRGKNSVETKVEHTIEHPEYEALFEINGESVEVTYYGYDNDGGASIYRIKQVKRGNITCNFNTQKSGNAIPMFIDDSAKAAGTKVKKPTKEELDQLNKEFITAATGICFESSGYDGIKMLNTNAGIKIDGEMCAINGNISGRNIHKSYDVDYELKITEQSGFGNSRWFGKSKEILDKEGNITGYTIDFNVYSYDSH